MRTLLWNVWKCNIFFFCNRSQKYGEFIGEDKYTTRESERLVRLPMYYNLSEEDITYVAELISRFYAR